MPPLPAPKIPERLPRILARATARASATSIAALAGQVLGHQFLGHLVRALPPRNPAAQDACTPNGRARGVRWSASRSIIATRCWHSPSELKIAYPLLVGEQDALDVAAAFGVESPVFPFTVFTDRRGEVVALFVGELHRPQAELILSAVQNLEPGSTRSCRRPRDAASPRACEQARPPTARLARFRRRSPPKLAISPPFLVIIADLCNATTLDLRRDGANSAAEWSELESARHREPAIYGSATLPSIETKLDEPGASRGHELIAAQSNAEHELIDEDSGDQSATASPSSSSIRAPTRTPASRCATPFSRWPCRSSKFI